MPDVNPLDTTASTSDAIDSLLDDVSGGDAQDISGAVDSTRDGAFGVLPGTGGTVYADVDHQELFTIDPETGDRETVNASSVSDYSEFEIVDDHQDSTFSDGLDPGSDPDLTTPAIELSTGTDFDSIGDDHSTDGDLSGADSDDYEL